MLERSRAFRAEFSTGLRIHITHIRIHFLSFYSLRDQRLFSGFAFSDQREKERKKRQNTEFEDRSDCECWANMTNLITQMIFRSLLITHVVLSRLVNDTPIKYKESD